MRLIKHVLFWVGIMAFLTATFGKADGQYIKSFYYVSFLLPVAIGTSYLFNYWLVPNYLLQQHYWKFGLYCVYTLIVSLYFEMLVLTTAFIVLANYQYANLNPYSTNLFLLTTTIYCIVFANAFIRLIKRYQRKEHLLNSMKERHQKNKTQHLIVKVDRQNKPIELEDLMVVESLADYVKLHLTSEHVITKEKIGKLQKELPDHFIRVHRSFIVNKYHIDTFGKEEVSINAMKIKISRTYKKEVLEALQA